MKYNIKNNGEILKIIFYSWISNGGIYPPNVLSNSLATEMVKRSCKGAATTWIPTGKCSSFKPSGTCVTGNFKALQSA